MKAGQLCTFRAKWVGRWYGELKVIADIGNRVYHYSYVKYGMTVPLLKLACRLGHVEQRTSISLRITGDKTVCKTCYRLRRRRAA